MEFFYHDLDQDVLVISADGGLNSSTAEQFVHDIEKLVDAGLRKIIVDCTQLTYVSSYGLSVLLRLHKRIKKHSGDVKICCVHSTLVKLLELVRLDKVFSVFPDLEQARLAFRPQA